MADNDQKSREQAAQALLEFVIGQIKAGASKATIVQKLVEMGVEESDATQVVQEIHSQVAAAVEKQRITGGAMLGGIVGGGLAAVLGGAVWGGIVIATDYEVSYMAWAMGILCGFAVMLFAAGSRGVPLQVIAVLCSCLGILISKYVTLFYYLRKSVADELGEEIASQVSMFSPGMLRAFLESAHLLFGGLDLLWIGLAVITAWQIPRGLGIKPV